MIAKAGLDPLDYGITSNKMWLFALAMYTPGSETEGNGTESARTAGYKGNDNVLAVKGYEQVRKDKIKLAKDAIQGNIAERFVLKAEKVIKRLALIGGIDEITAADKILTTTSSDQTRALDLLGKHLKLWDRAGEADHTDTPNPLTEQDLTTLKSMARTLTDKGLRAASGA